MIFELFLLSISIFMPKIVIYVACEIISLRFSESLLFVYIRLKSAVCLLSILKRLAVYLHFLKKCALVYFRYLFVIMPKMSNLFTFHKIKVLWYLKILLVKFTFSKSHFWPNSHLELSFSFLKIIFVDPYFSQIHNFEVILACDKINIREILF